MLQTPSNEVLPTLIAEIDTLREAMS